MRRLTSAQAGNSSPHIADNTPAVDISAALALCSQHPQTELKQLRDAASRADAWESGVERLLNRIDGKERQQQLRQQMQQQKQQQRQQQEMQAARDRLQQQDSQLSSFKQQLQDKQTELEASSAAAAVAW